jgi:glycosyltransferase involved in cell wall biosynthesis
MSVYNGARYLEESVRSVLQQEGVEFEFIIINDGSTDASGEMLSLFAREDQRIRLFEQSNQGLTKALIFGCEQSRAEFIARQDVGDRYLPGKLSQQARFLVAHPEVVMLSCGTRFVGPEREFLYETVQDTQAFASGLAALDFARIRGPSHHASMMFRSNAYHSVGGYRPEFSVAQDMDLWLRLAEVGSVASLPEVLIEAEIRPESISGRSRLRQMEMGKFLIECAHRRLRSEPEAPILEQVRQLSSAPISKSSAAASEANYFIARMLQNNRDPRCLKYFRRALVSSPTNWRAALLMLPALLQSAFSGLTNPAKVP